MAAVMGNAYSDVYSAIGVHSGLPYRSATDVVSAFTAMRGDPASGADLRINPADLGEPTPVRTIVFHGESDQTVHPSNAGKFVKSRLSAGGHVSQAEVHDSGARPFTRTIVRDDCGSGLIEQWLICGVGHAWSGGSAEGSYTDPQGPDASREMLRFFLDHTS
jgi:poly(3-hydroxybutyrate) depolymerase